MQMRLVDSCDEDEHTYEHHSGGGGVGDVVGGPDKAQREDRTQDAQSRSVPEVLPDGHWNRGEKRMSEGHRHDLSVNDTILPTCSTSDVRNARQSKIKPTRSVSERRQQHSCAMRLDERRQGSGMIRSVVPSMLDYLSDVASMVRLCRRKTQWSYEQCRSHTQCGKNGRRVGETVVWATLFVRYLGVGVRLVSRRLMHKHPLGCVLAQRWLIPKHPSG